MKKYHLFVCSLLFLFPFLLHAKEYKKEVIVYGNSSGAVTAAVQAAKAGKEVLFISTDPCIGGLTASGLGATDINEFSAIGGLSREFYQRIYTFYENPSRWVCQDKEEYFTSITKRVFTGRNKEASMQWVFEPHVAQQIFKEMLAEHSTIEIIFDRLQIPGGVKKKGEKIEKVYLASGNSCQGKVFIDASYEGDLMAHSGVSYFVGRESNQQYGETMNGILPNNHVKKSAFKIDPYRVEGKPDSGLLPFVEPRQPGQPGEGDKRLQAYCFRFTLTDNPQNRRPIEKPVDYEPMWYEYIARLLKANPNWTLTNVLTITPMPNRKSDINHADFVGANYEWPEASYARREEIKSMHRSFTLGLIWFLANDPRVPASIQNEMHRWGLAKDEFKDNGNFPYQLYVREARRMISDYVMTEHEVTGTKKAPYPIGLGTYWFDSHIVSRFVDETGALRDEGGFWGKQTVYPIGYQSIVPKKKECTNLLVPVCLSASHAAYGSIRMEPVYMVLGQSAGMAASLAIDTRTNVQDISYDRLKEKLLETGQLPEWNK